MKYIFKACTRYSSSKRLDNPPEAKPEVNQLNGQKTSQQNTVLRVQRSQRYPCQGFNYLWNKEKSNMTESQVLAANLLQRKVAK